MSRSKLLTCVFLATVIFGCIPVSLQPIYTENDLVFDPALVGKWKFEDQVWNFEKSNERYTLTITYGDGSNAIFDTHLVKLGDHRFLDLLPSPKDKEPFDAYGPTLIPAHAFLDVVQIEPTLKLRYFDIEWLDKLLKKSPRAVKHQTGSDWLVLTGDTRELQKFLKDYADKKGAMKDMEMKRVESMNKTKK